MKAESSSSESGETLCLQCAQRGPTCCQISDVYVSPGDIRRIRLQTGRTDFYHFRRSRDPAYSDFDENSLWGRCVLRKDGSRRVLHRTARGDCIFLGRNGCALTLEVRPLVCRLYPHLYDARGFDAALDPGCPVCDLAPSQQKHSRIAGFHSADLNRWHRMLYHEIQQEPDERLRIGLTFDLRSEYLAAGYGEEETAEFDREDTVESIEGALRSLGHETDRIGTARALIERLAGGERWDLVFNIAEGLHGSGREAQVPAILDVYAIAYTFSDPLGMALTLHKGLSKRVLRDAGVPTADFVEVHSEADLAAVGFTPPYFVKPVAEGTGKGVTPQSIVRRPDELAAVCRRLIDTYRQAVLVEPYLPGREFTVGILGTGERSAVLGTVEVHLLAGAEAGVYSYINKERCEELVEYRLVQADRDPLVAEAEAVALRAWKVLGCRDGGRVDLRCDSEGRPLFMEVNPLAGLHPHHSDLPILAEKIGLPYESLIGRIVESAAERLAARKPKSSEQKEYRQCG